MIEALSIWAILGLIVFLIAGVISAEMDSAFAALVTLVIGGVVLEWAMGISLWAALIAHWPWIFSGMVLYVAAGGLYTVVWRWPEYIRKHKADIMTTYSRWAANIKAGGNNSFDAYLDSKDYEYNASTHAERLSTWVILWPFSLSWELARKPAFWLGKTVYHSLGNTLQRVGRNTARKLHNTSE
jgi:hypothetical protein